MTSNASAFELFNVIEAADRVHMSLSADLKWLAFCLNGESEGYSEGVSDTVQGNKQWVCELETGKLIQVAPQAMSSWAGVWSPDGKDLAFFADIDGVARMWIWSSSDQTLKLASKTKARPYFGFEKPIWTKDGKGIIFKAMPDEEEVDGRFFYSFSSEETAEAKKMPFIFSTQSSLQTTDNTNILPWENRYRADIVIIDLITGDARPLCNGKRPVGISLSPDGRKLIFASCEGEEILNSQQNSFQLWVCDVSENPSPLCIAQDVRFDYGLSFSWALDSEAIYYTTRGPLSDGGLWSVKLSNPNANELIGKPQGIHLGREYDAPIPRANGEIITVARGELWIYNPYLNDFKAIQFDRKIIAALTPSYSDDFILVQTRESNDGLDGFWKIDLNTAKPEKILEERLGHLPWFEGGAAYASVNGTGVLAYIAQNADQPPALRILNLSLDEPMVIELSNINKNHLGTTQLLSWNSKNRNVKGALLLPKDVSGRVPVIMRVYGGSMQSNSYRFFGLNTSAADNHHIFASHGYAVFLPDLPMDRTHEPVEEIVTAIKDALHALKQHPNIDYNRIGIIGHSFGGYSTLAAVTQIPVFKAAVASAGIGNLISFYTNFDPFLPVFNYGMVEDGQSNMGDSLWSERERYIRNSPLFDLDKIEAPILLIQGIRDHLCRNEAGPLFAAFNRLGKIAQLVIYDEKHWQGTWKRENLEDYYKRVLEWFGKHL
jgi:dipeptidyl aminopeptidase/acylaminoacyl peptidase